MNRKGIRNTIIGAGAGSAALAAYSVHQAVEASRNDDAELKAKASVGFAAGSALFALSAVSLLVSLFAFRKK